MKKVILSSIFAGLFLWLNPAIVTVINTNDVGAGSLRQAIADVNADPTSPRIIDFAIPGAPPFTIVPLSLLPTITVSNVLIDGTSQPGWAIDNPVVIVDGSSMGGGAGDGILSLESVSSCTIQGLVLNNAIGSDRAGIIIKDNGSIASQFNSIFGCFIGTAQDGTTAQPNEFGISLGIISGLPNLVSNNQIGGALAGQKNVVSGNADAGIIVNISANNNIIQGNYIGTDKTGSLAVPNLQGIILTSTVLATFIDGTIIGGSNAGEGNVISGNSAEGILMVRNVINSIIQGNFIGTDPSTTLLLGNGSSGISIVLGDEINNLVGGTAFNQANVIKNNQANGVFLSRQNAGTVRLNPILGNSIFNNAANGIELTDANNNQLPPSIIFASLCGTTVTITAQAPPAPVASNFRLEFFNNNQNNNPITEGERFIGAIPSVPTSGIVSQTFIVPGISSGSWISATATNLNNTGGTPGNTSEFTLNTVLTSSVLAQLTTSTSSLCLGGSATLTATFTGEQPFDLVWSDGLMQTVTASPVARIVSPIITTEYSVLVTDSTGCFDTSNTVTIVISPDIDELTANPTLICLGQTATLTVTFTGIAPFNLSWSDGFNQVAGASPVNREVSPGATTVYTVTVFDSNGCFDISNTLTITVLASLGANLSVDPAQICAGQSTTLTATFTGTAPFNVSWSDGFMQIVGASPVNRIVNPIITTNYFFIVNDANGCNDVSNSVTVTVVPTVDAVLIANPGEICAGQPSTLTVTFTGTPPFNLSWSDGFMQAAGASPVNRIVNPLVTTNYFVAITDTNGCISNSNSVTVTIAAAIDAALVANPGEICAGQPSTLTVTFTGTPPFNLSWSDGFMQVAGASPVNRIVNPLVTTNYFVAITDTNGCISNSNSVTVTIAAAIDAVLTASPSQICQGQSCTLSASFTGTPPFSLAWSDGFGQVAGASPVNRIVSPAVTTNYSVVITDANGCISNSNTVTVIVSALEVNLTAIPQSICRGSSAQLLLSIVGGTAPYSIVWSDGFMQVSAFPNVVRLVSPIQATIYSAQVTDATGCAGNSPEVCIDVFNCPLIPL